MEGEESRGKVRKKEEGNESERSVRRGRWEKLKTRRKRIKVEN